MIHRQRRTITAWIALAVAALVSGPLTGAPAAAGTQPAGLLRVSTANPHWLVRADDTTKAIVLSGSHTWTTGNDISPGDPPVTLNFTQFLDFLSAYGHNFTRLWFWEQAQGVSETTVPYNIRPHPWKRTGPGLALDGKPKFNLDSLDETWFARLHARIDSARMRGIYCSVMLFNGWSVSSRGDVGTPWRGHPMNASNNVNGVNGDTNGDGNGEEAHSLSIPAVFSYQVAYVKRMIDRLNDIDNLVWEISNESSYTGSVAWQKAIIDTIKAYEASKQKQHLVWFTGDWFFANTELFGSKADIVSPGAGNNGNSWETDPQDAGGAKVVIVDTDHLWGLGGDRFWAWKSFMRGNHPVFMDPWNFAYPLPAGYDSSNAQWVSPRLTLGYIVALAAQINLLRMVPRGDLASTGYCLASNDPVNPRFLVYQPASAATFTLNMSGLTGQYAAEWINPLNGSSTTGDTVTAGGVVSLTPPFASDAVVQVHILHPLPIQLSSFTASVTGAQSIALRWTTVSEINNYGFTVERKLDGAADWVDLPGSFTAGQRTTLQAHQYVYTDPTPLRGTWLYRLKQMDLDGAIHFTEPLRVTVAADPAGAAPPSRFSLRQNYPNPFNPSTQIRYDVPQTARVTIRVFDVAGRQVRVLVDSVQPAGRLTALWDGRDQAGRTAAAGLYLCRMDAGSFMATIKLLLLK